MSTAPTPARQFAQFGLACAGATLAATAWSAGIGEPALTLGERLWREEVAANEAHEAGEGWYELTVTPDAVRVQARRPDCGDEGLAANAMYLHLPGTRLLEGVRVNHLFPADAFRTQVGREYALSIGRTDFDFALRRVAAGMQMTVRHGGQARDYLLGPGDAPAQVHAVADLDGDRLPDLLVQVGDAVYLLLSAHGRPGINLPSAQLWAAR
jgi:hypothetical protein